MVSMKNIVLENGIISAMCYMEDEPQRMFILKIASSDFHIIETSLEHPNIYCRMALNKIRTVYVSEKVLPTELYSVWC